MSQHQLTSGSESNTREATRVKHDETRLHGYWLVLVWLLCLTLDVLSVGLFIASIGDMRRLHELGLLPDFFATYTLVLMSISALGYWLVAAFLFWHKSTDRAILLIPLVLVLTGGVFFPPIPHAFMNDGAWWAPVDILEFLGGFSLIFVYPFPDGRFVPGLTRWVVLLISNRFSCRTRRAKKKRKMYIEGGIGACLMEVVRPLVTIRVR